MAAIILGFDPATEWLNARGYTVEGVGMAGGAARKRVGELGDEDSLVLSSGLGLTVRANAAANRGAKVWVVSSEPGLLAQAAELKVEVLSEPRLGETAKLLGLDVSQYAAADDMLSADSFSDNVSEMEQQVSPVERPTERIVPPSQPAPSAQMPSPTQTPPQTLSQPQNQSASSMPQVPQSRPDRDDTASSMPPTGNLKTMERPTLKTLETLPAPIETPVPQPQPAQSVAEMLGSPGDGYTGTQTTSGTVIFFASPRGQVGKTTTVMNAAYISASHNAKVAVVCADFFDQGLRHRVQIPTDSHDMATIRENWDGNPGSLSRYVVASPTLPNINLILSADKAKFDTGHIRPEDYYNVIQALRQTNNLVFVDTTPLENAGAPIAGFEGGALQKAILESYKRQWTEQVLMRMLLEPNSHDFLTVCSSVDTSTLQSVYEWIATLEQNGVNRDRLRVVVSDTTDNEVLDVERVRSVFRFYSPILLPHTGAHSVQSLTRQPPNPEGEYKRRMYELLFSLTANRRFILEDPKPQGFFSKLFGRKK